MRKKKEQVEPTELNDVDKKYIDLILKTTVMTNPPEVFARIAEDIKKDIKLIADYANKVGVRVEYQQLPPKTTKAELTPKQKMARKMLTPNSDTEPINARHVTVMSEMSSEYIEKTPTGPIKGSSKYKDCIFRPN